MFAPGTSKRLGLVLTGDYYATMVPTLRRSAKASGVSA